MPKADLAPKPLNDILKSCEKLFDDDVKRPGILLVKSEKEDFEFKIADNVTAMEKFQDLKSEAKKREGEKPFRNIKFWKKHWKIMKNNGFEELILAKNKDRIEEKTNWQTNRNLRLNIQ